MQVIDRGGVCRRDSAGHPLASAAEACRTDLKGRKDREGREGRETELGVGRRPLRC